MFGSGIIRPFLLNFGSNKAQGGLSGNGDNCGGGESGKSGSSVKGEPKGVSIAGNSGDVGGRFSVTSGSGVTLGAESLFEGSEDAESEGITPPQ